MFVSENVPALFKKGTLKLEKTDDGYRRVAEATLVIEPFPVELAREIGEEVAGHLFDDEGNIRDEIESIDLRVRSGLQAVTVSHHQDLEPVAIISPASIRDVSATVIEDKKTGRCWLSLSFVIVFSLEDRETRDFVLDEFGRTLCWTFRRVDPELEGLARAKEAAARMADSVDGEGITSMSISSGGKTVTLDKNDAKRLRKEAADLRARTH